MSPEEVLLLQHAGESILADIRGVVTQSILYGLYLAIFGFGIRALMRSQSKTRSTWILFGFLSILFLISTADLALQITFLVGIIQGGLIDNGDLPLLSRFQFANAHVTVFDVCEEWFGNDSGTGLLFVFADAVVVWRACVLWPGNKIVKTILLTLLLCSLGSTIATGTLNTLTTVLSTVATSSPLGNMIILTQSLSLATNIVATATIGIKAFQHRKMMKANLGTNNSKTGAILLFLMESGIAFCILQIVEIGASIPDNTPFSLLDRFSGTWQQITTFAAAAYPVLVVIIVDSHRSISDHTSDSGFAQKCNNGNLGIGSHMSFTARDGITSVNGVGGESVVGTHFDPTITIRHSLELARMHMKDVEKGLSPVSETEDVAFCLNFEP